jgi:hypothetical protein
MLIVLQIAILFLFYHLLLPFMLLLVVDVVFKQRAFLLHVL